MTDINSPFATENWTGSAQDCETARQFARDFAWGSPIESGNEVHAADEVVSQLRQGIEDEGGELDEEAKGILLSALEESAAMSRGCGCSNCVDGCRDCLPDGE